MSSGSENSYARFLQVNSGRNVSGLDYVRSVYKSIDVPNDFLIWFSRVFLPDFEVHDNRAFVRFLYDEERYLDYCHSSGGESAQYWSNLLEVTGVFDEVSTEDALELANRVVFCWNSKLDSEFSKDVGRARVVCDEISKEVFVTIASV